MASTQFFKGWTIENHPQAKVITMIKREAAIAELVALAADWRQAAGGQSLTEIKASVGLLLADFAAILEMTPEESENLLNPQ